MAHNRSAAIYRSTRPHGWPLALRCLLLVAAWQGPVPWCHSHDALVDTAVMPPSCLTQHLRVHHEEIASAESLGWHFHVSFPTSSGDDPAEPAKQDWHPYRPTLSHGDCTVPLDPFKATGPIALFAALHWARSPIVIDQRAFLHGHFFEAFAPTLPMPLRFGILRC